MVICALLAVLTLVPGLHAGGILTYQTVHSPGLEKNLLGDSPNRQVLVYLPPSYVDAPHKRYPTVYLLHGFNGTSTTWRDGAYQGLNIQKSMDTLIQQGKVREMIVVMPDGRNAYGGSYFVNSSVTGDWEDFVTEDLVRFVDSRYRTLANPESRAISGQSMGGYAAIYLAMRNSDVYSAVYGLSPCCLEMLADIEAANPEWPATLQLGNRDDLIQSHLTTPSGGNYPNALTALAAAVSPNPNKAPLFVDFPFQMLDGRVVKVDEVYSKWLSHFPTRMIAQYRPHLEKLRGIRIAIGLSDRLPHIPRGSRAFSAALKKADIPHVLDEYDANHNELVRFWIESKVMPFFTTTLDFQSPVWSGGHD